ncbi:hypothetical protein LROSRS0_1671 [Furfurilactobacillus rossiae]|nr:hypothetical protein LROSRS0_1671 [Furfurilactobacillus rossiae]
MPSFFVLVHPFKNLDHSANRLFHYMNGTDIST